MWLTEIDKHSKYPLHLQQYPEAIFLFETFHAVMFEHHKMDVAALLKHCIISYGTTSMIFETVHWVERTRL